MRRNQLKVDGAGLESFFCDDTLLSVPCVQPDLARCGRCRTLEPELLAADPTHEVQCERTKGRPLLLIVERLEVDELVR